MSSEWKTTKLLDHYDIRSGLSKPAKDFGSGYPFLTFKDVFYNFFVPDTLGDLVESSDREREACSVMRGDVFLTRTSETMHELGMSCVALKNYENATFNGFCKRLRPKPEIELEAEYVGYFLRAPQFRQAMLAFSTMSTRASLNNEMICRLEISYPSRREQKQIANILKALDDRIALLRETNTTLEAIAQALFKSWFVDFDPVHAKARGESPQGMDDATAALFPDSFEQSELGMIPKGWRVKSFGEFVTRQSVGKKYDQKSALPEGLIPILDQGKSGIIGFHNDEPGVRASLDKPVVVFANHTCYMRLITFDFSAIQNVLPFIGKGIDTVWAFYATKDRVKFSEYKGHWPDFAIEKAVIPDDHLTFAFRNIVDSIVRGMRSNEQQAQTLSQLRDTLLPKLISGQLRLPEAEALLAEALP